MYSNTGMIDPSISAIFHVHQFCVTLWSTLLFARDIAYHQIYFPLLRKKWIIFYLYDAKDDKKAARQRHDLVI